MTLDEFEARVFERASTSRMCDIPVVRRATATAINIRIGLIPGGFIAMICWLLYRAGRWPFLQALVGLAVIGGMSHLALDAFSHSTPLLYPVSMSMFGAPSERVLAGGFWAYITDPVFLAEPCLLALAAAYWISRRNLEPRRRKLALIALGCGMALFSAVFLSLLPRLQVVVINSMPG